VNQFPLPNHLALDLCGGNHRDVSGRQQVHDKWKNPSVKSHDNSNFNLPFGLFGLSLWPAFVGQLLKARSLHYHETCPTYVLCPTWWYHKNTKIYIFTEKCANRWYDVWYIIVRFRVKHSVYNKRYLLTAAIGISASTLVLWPNDWFLNAKYRWPKALVTDLDIFRSKAGVPSMNDTKFNITHLHYLLLYL